MLIGADSVSVIVNSEKKDTVSIVVTVISCVSVSVVVLSSISVNVVLIVSVGILISSIISNDLLDETKKLLLVSVALT